MGKLVAKLTQILYTQIHFSMYLILDFICYFFTYHILFETSFTLCLWCHNDLGTPLGLEQSFSITEIVIQHAWTTTSFNSVDFRAHIHHLLCAQIMRWDGRFGGLFTDRPDSAIPVLLTQWLIDLTKTVYKAEKNGVGSQISYLQARSVWFSGELRTRTTSSCSQPNCNALLFATTTNELHNIKVIGSCRTNTRHPNSVILLWLVILDMIFTV